MEEFFTPTLSHQMRLYPRKNHHTPTDAILILDLEDGSTSRFPVHKLILAAQSEFFEGLFTFEEQKIEFHIKSPPDLKNYLTEENEDFFGESSNQGKYVLNMYILYKICNESLFTIHIEETYAIKCLT